MAIRILTERAALALALALSFATATRRAHAEPPRASLVVTRGSGAQDCPDVDGLAARIRPLTRANVFETSPDAPPDTWIQVELSRELSGYRAVIAARGRRQGTRHIEDVGASCTSMADAVAITLVMLLDPEPAQPTSRPAPAPPRADTTPAAVSPPRHVRFLSPGVEADGGASIFILSHAAPLLEAGPWLGVGRRVALAAGGGIVFPDRVLSQNGSVRLELVYAYLRASFTLFDNGATRLGLTAGPLLGSLSGQGSNSFEFPKTRHLLWGAGAAGTEVFALLAPRVSWSARLLVLVPAVREGFYVREGGTPHEAFRVSAIGGVLSVGLSAAL